jgi:para-aminobenzoate synthetase component 1
MKLSTLSGRRSFALLGPGFDAAGRLTLVEGLAVDDASPLVAFVPYEGDPRSPSCWSGRRTFLDALEVDVPEAWLPVLSFDEGAYRRGVESIRRDVEAGDVYQVNLTSRVALGPADPARLWARLTRRGVPPYAAWVRVEGLEFVSASPELFFVVDGRRVAAQPMKGTAPAGRAADLLASVKDEAELAMITDLLRHDLTPLCEPRSVRVVAERRLVELPYAVQAVSDVEGRLCEGRGWREVLAGLHPGGSITGAPKSTACERIAALEVGPRGPYCGTLMAIDGARAVAALLIRTASRNASGDFVYGVGAGITWGSDPHREVEELRVKLGALS